MHTQEQLIAESNTLHSCPFCGGKATFVQDKSGNLIIEHTPAAAILRRGK